MAMEQTTHHPCRQLPGPLFTHSSLIKPKHIKVHSQLIHSHWDLTLDMDQGPVLSTERGQVQTMRQEPVQTTDQGLALPIEDHRSLPVRTTSSREATTKHNSTNRPLPTTTITLVLPHLVGMLTHLAEDDVRRLLMLDATHHPCPNSKKSRKNQTISSLTPCPLRLLTVQKKKKRVRLTSPRCRRS